MFFAPALLWIGATLLLVRLRGRGAGAGSRAARPAVAPAPRRGFLLASAGRRGAAINRGLVVVGLLLAFGVNLGLFTATYDQQAAVDAQLTLGADVTATAPPGVAASHRLAAKIAAVPGVQATTRRRPLLRLRRAPTSRTPTASTPRRSTRPRRCATPTSSAPAPSRRSIACATRPTGSSSPRRRSATTSSTSATCCELRVLDHRSGQFHVVPFHVVGVVQEFPSAPRDSFMVANLAYLQAADHAGGPNVVFAKAADPAAASRAVAQATRRDGTIVNNIDRADPADGQLDHDRRPARDQPRSRRLFTVVLAAAAMALFVALAVIERRHEFATMAALGADLRSIGAFVWSEAALVLVGSLVLAAGLGLLLALMLVAMLQHVFDPPPDALAVPWAYLAELAAAAVIAAAAAVGIASRRLRGLPLGRLLREQ